MRKTMLTILVLLLFAGSALAIPLDRTPNTDGTPNDLQDVLDGITVNGPSSVDVYTDMFNDSSDSYWDLTASAGSVTTMIIELAGYASHNVFGVYNNGNYVALFEGSDSVANAAQVTLSLLLDGSVRVNGVDSGIDFTGSFGYFLDSSYYAGGGLFHSDTSMNADGVDHMLAYQGTNTDTVQIGLFQAGLWTNNEYVLAFEDLCGGGDYDYTDMVVMVESVAPVPEPATLLLLGSGLVGLAFLKRRKS